MERSIQLGDAQKLIGCLRLKICHWIHRPPAFPRRRSRKTTSQPLEYSTFLFLTTAAVYTAHISVGFLTSYLTITTASTLASHRTLATNAGQSQHGDTQHQRFLLIHQRPLALERNCAPRGEIQAIQHRGTQTSSRRGCRRAIMLTDDQARRGRLQKSLQTCDE